MKKMIFAAVVAALTLIACSKEASRECYHVNYLIPEQPQQVDSLGEVVREARPATTFDGYKWATDAEIKVIRAEWEKIGYQNILTEKVTERDGKTVKTMADCLAN